MNIMLDTSTPQLIDEQTVVTIERRNKQVGGNTQHTCHVAAARLGQPVDGKGEKAFCAPTRNKNKNWVVSQASASKGELK